MPLTIPSEDEDGEDDDGDDPPLVVLQPVALPKDTNEGGNGPIDNDEAPIIDAAISAESPF